MIATRRIDPAKTTAAARSFAGLARELGETEAAANVEDALARTESVLFRLVVVGEVKKGKSSLVNTLLGAPDLLPTSDDVATSTVFKVVHGTERRYRAFFRDLEDPYAEPEPRDITLEEAVALGTEDGRADGAGEGESHQPRLDFIAVELPHPLLADGLAIIDTPGLGALFRQHADITWRYVPNADAVLFVVDSQEALVSADEAKAVARLREITSAILFVQTKTDLAPDSWQGWRARNLEVLSQTLTMSPESLPYFPVSAALEAAGQRQASGFAPFRSYLEADLLGGKHERLARELMTVVVREAAHLHRRFAEELQVLESSSAEELKRLSDEAQAARRRFETWHSTDFREAMLAFRYSLTGLSQSFTQRCENEIDASPRGALINEMIERLREASMPARQIVKRWPEIAGEMADRCAQLGFAIEQDFEQRFDQLMESTGERLGRSVVAMVGSTGQAIGVRTEATSTGLPVPTTPLPEIQIKDLPVRFNRFEELRGIVYGSTLGWGVTAAVGGAVVTIFPPLLLSASLAALAGSAFGAWRGWSGVGERKREEALQHMEGALLDLVRRAQTAALQHFQRRVTDWTRAAIQAFGKAAEEISADLRRNAETLDMAQRSTRDETARTVGTLRSRLQRIDQAILELSACVGPAETEPAAAAAAVSVRPEPETA
jgi:GTP-binding protein EngB required for normal cell division